MRCSLYVPLFSDKEGSPTDVAHVSRVLKPSFAPYNCNIVVV